MLEYTPEGWSLGRTDDDEHYLIEDVQGVSIATVWRQPLDPPYWAESNAQLIVNAPKMYEILQSIVAAHTSGDMDAILSAIHPAYDVLGGMKIEILEEDEEE